MPLQPALRLQITFLYKADINIGSIQKSDNEGKAIL